MSDRAVREQAAEPGDTATVQRPGLRAGRGGGSGRARGGLTRVLMKSCLEPREKTQDMGQGTPEDSGVQGRPLTHPSGPASPAGQRAGG